ncbi:MAG: hypothetical protein HKO57_00325, partial [Akkermansiaceae bacterium]|nr:hypothetical protein [Akkermansiaceae bacterium]
PTQAATLTTDFQATIASEQHPNYPDEARYYHVSVNPANPGTGWYGADLPNSGDDAPTEVRNYTAPVVAYKFLGGTNNSVSGVSASGGEDTRITYATEDTAFDGFGQGQLRLWNATDPGADLATGAGTGATGFDGGGGGYRSFGGATGTLDISGLASGSVHIYYGAFGARPSVSLVMRDSSGLAPDITLADAHLNGDTANRT